MTTKEFSDGFDTLLNSYATKLNYFTDNNQSINLDEYEKSCFLTEAQEQLVISYYTGRNTGAESFEQTEEIRRYLSGLIKTSELTPESAGSLTKITPDSQIFSLPDDLWFITYESARLISSSNPCLSGKEIQVVPVTQDNFIRTVENPFKGPGMRRALRLDLQDNKVEIVSKYTIGTYLVRYITKISPIILITLSDGLSINGETEVTECSLHESLHRTILELAVRLALQSKGNQLQKQN